MLATRAIISDIGTYYTVSTLDTLPVGAKVLTTTNPSYSIAMRYFL